MRDATPKDVVDVPWHVSNTAGQGQAAEVGPDPGGELTPPGTCRLTEVDINIDASRGAWRRSGIRPPDAAPSPVAGGR